MDWEREKEENTRVNREGPLPASSYQLLTALHPLPWHEIQGGDCQQLPPVTLPLGGGGGEKIRLHL